jgi:hypothetical protein
MRQRCTETFQLRARLSQPESRYVIVVVSTDITPSSIYLTCLSRRIRHISQRDKKRPSPPPGPRRGKTRCFHPIRLSQTARRGSRSCCRNPQRPRRRLRLRPQRHYRHQHCPSKSGLSPRRCHHLLRDRVWCLWQIYHIHHRNNTSNRLLD